MPSDTIGTVANGHPGASCCDLRGVVNVGAALFTMVFFEIAGEAPESFGGNKSPGSLPRAGSSADTETRPTRA
jgi:hypothetical protein